MKTFPSLSAIVAVIAAAVLPSPALAEPGNSVTFQGMVGAVLEEPSTIQHIADLRFGRIYSPATAGTVRVLPNGNINTTGGVTAVVSSAQPPEGRGPAIFRIEQAGNRSFNVTTPNGLLLTSGSNSMTVTNITTHLQRTTHPGVNAIWQLEIGGRLNVNANQAVGKYRADFTVLVIYS